MSINKRFLPPAFFSAALAILPLTVFPACASHGHAAMPCQTSARVAAAIGVIALAGFLAAVFLPIAFGKGAAFSAALSSLIAPVVTHWLIGICAMETMACRTGMAPAIDVSTALLVGSAAAAIIWPGKRETIAIGDGNAA